MPQRVYIKDYDTYVNIPDGADMNKVQAALAQQFPAKAPAMVSAPTSSALVSNPTGAGEAPKPAAPGPGDYREAPEWGRKYPNLYGAAGAARETLGPIIEALSMAGGAILGAGGTAPTGPGALAGGAAGAGLGYAGAKNLLESIDAALGNAKPKTITEQVIEAPGEVATGAAMEMGGQVIGKGISATLEKVFEQTGKLKPINWLGARYRSSQKNPFAKEGARLQKETGIEFTPAQETGDKLLSFAENTARKSPVTMEQIHVKDVEQANQAINKVNSLLDKIGKPGKGAESVGLEVQHSVNRAIDLVQKTRRAQADVDYGAVRMLAGDKPVINLQNFSDELRGIVKEYSIPGGDRVAKQAEQMLKEVSKLRNTVSKGGKFLSAVDIKKALNMRHVYSQSARGTGDVFKDIDKSQSRMLSGRLMKALEADFENAPTTIEGMGNLADALKVANANYRNYSQHIDAIENSVLGKMLGKNTFDPLSGQTINSIAPEKIAERIINLHPSELLTVRRILSGKSPETWNTVRRYSLERALQKGMDVPPSSGMRSVPLSTSKLINNMPERKSLEVLFGSKELKEINDIQQALLRIGDRTGTNTSGTAITTDFLQMLSPRGMARAAAKVVGLKTIANAMTTAEGRAALKKMAEVSVNPAKYEAAAKAIMLQYGLPQVDIASEAEAGTLTDDVSTYRAAMRDAARDNTPVRPAARPNAAPARQGTTSRPLMSESELAAYQAETERMKQAQASKGTRKAYIEVEPVNVIKKDRQGNIVEETLMYRDKRGKLYPEDPNI